MSKKIIYLSIFLITAIAICFSGINTGNARSAGAPAGVTGSPFDGATCYQTTCHNSHTKPSLKPWISSNVPVSGYVPNTTYTMTARAVKTGFTNFGFEISPQTPGGSPLGTMSLINATTTQIETQGPQYITHTSNGYQGTDSLVWTFKWKAPVSGTGTATFYGAFNCGKNDDATTAYIYQDSLKIPENTGVGVNNIAAEVTSFSIFPNPAREQFNITYNLKEESDVEINMYGIDGRKVSNLMNNSVVEGEHIQLFTIHNSQFTINPGVYFVQFIANGQSSVQRIIVE